MLNDPKLELLSPLPVADSDRAIPLTVNITPEGAGLLQAEQVQIKGADATLVLEGALKAIPRDAASEASDFTGACRLYDGGQFQAAAGAFLALTCKSEQTGLSLLGLSAALLRMHKAKEAAQIARFLTTALPDSPRVMAILGFALNNTRKFKESRQVLSRLAFIARKNPDHMPYLRFAQNTLLQQQFRKDLLADS